MVNCNSKGDRFQCDEIFSNGYTYYIYFQNQAPPKTFIDIKCLHFMPDFMRSFKRTPLEITECTMEKL